MTLTYENTEVLRLANEDIKIMRSVVNESSTITFHFMKKLGTNRSK